MVTEESTEPTGPGMIALINARFTGLIVAAVTATWLAAAILRQLGYGDPPGDLGRITEVLLVAYVVKKAYQTTNGNGVK